MAGPRESTATQWRSGRGRRAKMLKVSREGDPPPRQPRRTHAPPAPLPPDRNAFWQLSLLSSAANSRCACRPVDVDRSSFYLVGSYKSESRKPAVIAVWQIVPNNKER